MTVGRFREASSDEDSEGGIDISPLMDCVFILLIFFIVTTTFVEESGVEVDKPQAGGASTNEKTTIIIELTERGDVICDGSKAGLSGVRAHVKRMLTEEDTPVVIRADAAAQAALLVRVIDEAKQGGAKRVSVATRKGRT